MEWLSRLAMRTRALLHREAIHDEIAEEWRLHVDLRTEENIRRGMNPDEARRGAERSFGNAGYIKDVSWDVRGGGVMERIWHDMRFAARQLRRSPGFTAVALLSLALGIGANAAIFSLISMVLLRPLPISHPEQVFSVDQGRQKDPDYSQSMSYPNYKDIRDRNQVLEGIALHRFAPMSVSHNGSNERVWGYLVTGNYFDVLGVKAFMGRTIANSDDDAPNAHPVTVLSYGCWQRRFGADPNIIGSTLTINGHSFIAIGVAPPGFLGTETVFTPEFWVPSLMQGWIEGFEGWKFRGNGAWHAIGRLKVGVKREQAVAQLNSIARQLARDYPDTNPDMAVMLNPPGLIEPDVRSAVVAFSGALLLTVLLVLLIACTNLASLLLARATQRRKEIAVRMAIGATRARLTCQLLTESVMLSVTGAAMGLAVGWALIQVAQASLPQTDFALSMDLRMDWRVVVFVTSLAVLTGIGFGLVPALHASRPDVVSALKEEAGGRQRARLRSLLVTLQVALSFVLLIAAGLTIRSLQHTQALGPGFDPNNALTLSVDLGLQRYDQAKGENFYKQLRKHVLALPGVSAAGFVARLPLGLDNSSTGASPAGEAQPRSQDMSSCYYDSVTPGYFAAMGIPLVAGRDFAETDTDKAPRVAIVNETLARNFWPGQNPVGKRLNTGTTDEAKVVVGVAKSGKYYNLGETPALMVYFPETQYYESAAALVVRTQMDPQASLASVQGEVRKLDPDLPVYAAKTLREHMKLSLFPLHAAAAAVGSFALLAMILAAIGIYGVMAYSIGQRTREIGIRMALGAKATDVWQMVLKQGIVITVGGIILGIACAISVSSIVANLLVGVSATDPVTFLGITLLLAAVAIAACFVPARRATRVDPVNAIRTL